MTDQPPRSSAVAISLPADLCAAPGEAPVWPAIWHRACRHIEALLAGETPASNTEVVAAAPSTSPSFTLTDGTRLTLERDHHRLVAVPDTALAGGPCADTACVQGCLSAIIAIVSNRDGYVDDKTRRWLLAAGDGGPGTAAAPLTITARFAAVRARRPDVVALESRGADCDAPRRAWTWAELDQASHAAAARLVAAGVRHGDIVATLLPRTGEAVVALLAIARAGAAYAPIDPSFPPERVGMLCRDAVVRALIVDATTAATAAAAATDAPMLALSLLVPADTPDTATCATPEQHGASATQATAADDISAIGIGADDLACLMYTSGSTGLPKGARIPHRAVVQLATGQRFAPLDEDSVLLQAAPHGFDAATLEIWGALLNGGRCVVHEEAVPTAAGLARTIRQAAVDTAWLTASLFNRIVDEDPAALEGLSTLLTGGEALSIPHVRKALHALPGTTIVNGYGPTETTTFAVTGVVDASDLNHLHSVPIGKPIAATLLRVLTPDGQLAPPGLPGELLIGGPRVADGYHGRPELTRERFIADPLGVAAGRFYRTGDRVRWLTDGRLEFLGRIDNQIKIRGHRVEPGEIEAVLLAHPDIAEAAVSPRPGPDGQWQLVAWLAPQAGATLPDVAALRTHCRQKLPPVMMPARFVPVARLPLTANGKLDRRSLPEPAGAASSAPITPQDDARLEALIRDTLRQLLDLPDIGRDDNFFELGGSSLSAASAIAALNACLGSRLDITDLFAAPTPAGLARRVGRTSSAGVGRVEGDSMHPTAAVTDRAIDAASASVPIAIIGMAGRFPGAGDVETLWQNLLAGRDGIRHFDDLELDPSIAADIRNDPDYVRARGVLDDVDQFDAAFFGISPREAELMDPQQRVFLETAWTCLENAGHPPRGATGPVGVFAGMYNASYFLRHVQHHPERIAAVGEFQVMLANEKDYIATRTAHRLDLTGPAVSVHTACSTSLVAIVQAVNSLRQGQCRMALAGGVAITCPPASGYRHEAGSMLSPDGRTRSFDASAAGTVFSDGVAVVLLKRLPDALADRDTIHAVIRGVAINNDGSNKASFTAPSVDGQVAVIRAALADAGVPARSIGYVEAHGTATPMGDPIEVAALTQAWRVETPDRGFAGIGSIKSAIGHTVIAAGAAGLIKTACALARECIPQTLHYQTPNPAIDFAASPVAVVAENRRWPRGRTPRRAAVSAFGVGGTNAHVIVEEAPAVPPRPAPAPGPRLLPLAARSTTALQAQAKQLAAFLAQRMADANPPDLDDVAWTLRHGRSRFRHRAAFAVDSVADAIAQLQGGIVSTTAQAVAGDRAPGVVFCFSGQGSQYAGMGRVLYEQDPRFRAHLDRTLAAIGDVAAARAAGHRDLKDVLFNASADALEQTALTQPALFALQVALAARWQDDGVQPVAVLGHSIGEYAAAVVAGIMTVTEAARVVVARGALAQSMPVGSMLAIQADESAVSTRLPATLSLAAVNGPEAVVVAGPGAAIDAFAAQLDADGIASRRLATSHAFHSAMMAPALAPLRDTVAAITLRAPTLPLISTVTGGPLDASTATDPDYWARQLRAPVRFHAAAQQALADGPRIALEIGPRAVLTSLLRPLVSRSSAAGIAIASLGTAPADEARSLALARARLWCGGFEPTDAPARGRRIPLPTYPFERQRYWVETPALAQAAPASPPRSNPPHSLAAESAPAPVSPLPMIRNDAPSDRTATLLNQVLETIDAVCGIAVPTAEAGRAFVDLGLDSLLLTQLALQLKRRFTAPVTFRMLMESLQTPAAVASWLDAELPTAPDPTPVAEGSAARAGVTTTAATPDVAIAPVSLPSPNTIAATTTALAAAAPDSWTPAGTAAAAGGSNGHALQRLIASQLELMSRQLALLSGHAAAIAMPAAQPAPTVASAPDAPLASTAPVPPPATVAGAAPIPAPATSATTAAAEAAGHAGRAGYDVTKAFGAIARIHGKTNTPLTPRQEARLDAFIRRYVERTAKSREYTTQHRGHLADPRVVNGFRPRLKEIIYQIVVERSQGAHVHDIDGNEYVDVLSGFGMSLFGWQPDFVVEAVRKTLDSGYEIGPQHPLAGEVARRVCALTGFDRAGLCNTGSEAVMGAIRIARTITGRDRIVIFSGAYHGIFDEVIVRTSPSGRSMPAAPGILPDTARNVVVLEYGSDQALEWIRAHGDELAAVLVEPVQSRRPDLQPREFLHQLRDSTRSTGTLLIFDEVVTGFRVGPGGAQEHFGIRADLATYGKVLGGGFPIGVIAGKREYMDALDGGDWRYGDDSVPTVGVTYFAGTFVRHPLALAAANAVLTRLQAEGPSLQQKLSRKTAALADELNAFCRETGAPVELRHFASVWRIAFTGEHPYQDLLFAMMRSRGIHILDNFPCFMTTAHSDEDIARIKMAFRESIAELQEAGFLPGKPTAGPAAIDPARPPAPGARLGRDAEGRAAWFMPDPNRPGGYIQLTTE